MTPLLEPYFCYQRVVCTITCQVIRWHAPIHYCEQTAKQVTKLCEDAANALSLGPGSLHPKPVSTYSSMERHPLVIFYVFVLMVGAVDL